MRHKILLARKRSAHLVSYSSFSDEFLIQIIVHVVNNLCRGNDKST